MQKILLVLLIIAVAVNAASLKNNTTKKVENKSCGRHGDPVSNFLSMFSFKMYKVTPIFFVWKSYFSDFFSILVCQQCTVLHYCTNAMSHLCKQMPGHNNCR